MSVEPMPENELSRVIASEALAKGPVELTVTASPAERRALARRFGLLDCKSLQARVRTRPRSKGLIVVLTADLEAEVVQPCVVSLEPVAGKVRESFDMLVTLEPEGADTVELEIDPEGPDPAEPVGPEGLDVGELLAQQLALCLDPYPRHPDSGLLTVSGDGTAVGDDGPVSPFAALKALKDGA